MLTLYVGLGLLALGQSAAQGAVTPMVVAALVLLFLLAYLTYGALMLTVGAAVSSNADAQSLLGPVMVLLLVPYFLAVYVGMTPGLTLWAILSFVPPVNSFIMLARVASDTPPPFWEVLLSFGVGMMFVACVLWFAAKVFKVALLMHGKPPSIATLVRWARMA
jgi:ABC-2 type transport system permease protein